MVALMVFMAWNMRLLNITYCQVTQAVVYLSQESILFQLLGSRFASVTAVTARFYLQFEFSCCADNCTIVGSCI